MTWTTNDMPDQHGRVALVTGANAGLGLATTEALARAGAHVVLACRDTAKGEAAAATLTALHPEASVSVQALDLADLASVAAGAHAVLAAHDRLDLLVNNAGLMAVDESRTADGFETQFGVNHLGHFALTARLLPRLLATPGSRVVTVSSIAHRMGRLDLDDPNAERSGYSRWGAYGQSKLANIAFTLELQRRLDASGTTTRALAAHPGMTRTDLGTEGTGALSSLMTPSAMPFSQSPDAGALPSLRAATDPAAEGGSYWGPRWLFRGPPRQETPSRRARRADDARALWELSEHLTGQSPTFPRP